MLQGDISALQMIESLPGVDPARRSNIMHVLDIDPEWRMHRVSDGQRRRVQICLGLLKPPEVRSLRALWSVMVLYSCSIEGVFESYSALSSGSMHTLTTVQILCALHIGTAAR